MTSPVSALPGSFLVFRLGGREFFFEARFLWEAGVEVPVTEVPRGKGCLVGVTQLHGKIIPVLDLSGLLGFRSIPEGAVGGFVTVEVLEPSAILVGFPVDSILGFSKVEIPSGQPSDLGIPYVKGSAPSGKGEWLWLDIERIAKEQSEARA